MAILKMIFGKHWISNNQYAKYWLASESIHCMDSVVIFYPEQNLRDTVKICRIEAQ